jgi:probable rRNA maturation factor
VTVPVLVNREDHADLVEDAERMLVALGWSHAEVSLVLVDDAGIRPLNAAWRGKDVPTDVLSFPQHLFSAPMQVDTPSPPGIPLILGDIVVSVETARRQAEAVGNTLTDELRVLVAHGLCHLLGHDHSDAVESRAMATDERRALRACSLSTPSLVGRATSG